MRDFKTFIFVIVSAILSSCGNNVGNPDAVFSKSEQDKLLIGLGPYIHKKPKEAIDFEDRFRDEFRPYFAERVNTLGIRFLRIVKNDNGGYYFMLIMKDQKSLYEHYRLHGGRFVLDKLNNPTDVEMIFVSERFTVEDVEAKGGEIFNEMIETGGVQRFFGNRSYLYLPNPDFEYQKEQKRWWYTDSSSWNFLREVKGEQ